MQIAVSLIHSTQICFHPFNELIFFIFGIQAGNATKRQPLLNSDKENVQQNGDRAILAVSLVTKKQPSETQKSKKPSILKNVLKKSLSVPSAPVAALPHKPVAPPTFKKPTTNIGQRQHAYAETIKKHKEELAKKIKQMEEKEMKFRYYLFHLFNYLHILLIFLFLVSKQKQHRSSVTKKPLPLTNPLKTRSQLLSRILFRQ